MGVTKAIPSSLLKTSMDGDMAKNENTKPVRLHIDVAELAEKLAAIFGESLPDFLSNRLRPLLDGLRKEAAAKLLEEKPATKRK